ncbi:hypothetical protein KW782_02050 [Candidatus Parcubacteria bacterium]|nr:hypothetical protein [Candidatus Parcubacteria bacterium]
MTEERQKLMDMLHDMRSPLAALVLSLDLLETQKAGTLNKMQTQLLSSMRQSVEKLRHTIDQSVLSQV